MLNAQICLKFPQIESLRYFEIRFYKSLAKNNFSDHFLLNLFKD